MDHKLFLDSLMQKANTLSIKKNDDAMYDMGYKAGVNDLVSAMVGTLYNKKTLKGQDNVKEKSHKNRV